MPRGSALRSRPGLFPVILGVLILAGLLDALLLSGDVANAIAWCLLIIPLGVAARVLLRAFG